MGTINLGPFRGEFTREGRHGKENIYATCAINARLHDGRLSAFPCPELICSHPFTPRAIYSHDGCDCVAWEYDTYVDEDRRFIYWHDNQRIYKSPKDCFCDDITYRIGMPCPRTAPSASGSGSGCDFDPRTYYYTYVAKYCDGCESEGPLSPPSNNVVCGGSASVGGISNPPANYGITHVRIYRSVAGWKSGEEGATQNNSGILMVGEVPAGQNFTDNVPLDQLGMISPITYDMESLPANGDGVGVSGFSTFVWKDNDLYISADGMVDVYHKRGHFCFDHDIVAAKYWNGSIYVFTERYNYRIDEQAGDGGVAYSNPPYRFENIAPIINQYSISVGNSGVYYITQAGVGRLSGNQYSMISSTEFSTDQWKSHNSRLARTHIYQQYLFIYSPYWGSAHVLEIDDGVFDDIPYSNHFRYPYPITAMYTTDDGDLRFAMGDDNSVYRFVEEECFVTTTCDPREPAVCRPCCPYDYRIVISDIAEIGDLASAYMDIDPAYGELTISLWRGDCGAGELLFRKTISGCYEEEFKLPGCGPLTGEHILQLTGCAVVNPGSRLGTNAKLLGRNNR